MRLIDCELTFWINTGYLPVRHSKSLMLELREFERSKLSVDIQKERFLEQEEVCLRFLGLCEM